NQFKFVFMNQGRHVKQDEVDSAPRKAVWSKPIRYYVIVTGNDKNCHKEVLRRLCISTRDLVPSVDECDVILAFIPVVSRAGTDIETALTSIPDVRPAVIVVLHHTFDRDYVAPDSRRIITRSNMLAVDCLFYEDQGLLECRRSNGLQFYMMVLGNTLGAETDVIKRLKNRFPLREVCKEEECDVIIAFVPIVSQAGTDIEAALQKIQTSRPVVLVVLHHTFDTDYIAPDSTHCVNREGVLAVDLVFYEGIGLLRNLRNDEALKSITDDLKSKSASPDAPPEFLNRLRQRLQLTEASAKDHCDFIIAFVPLVSRAGTDLQAAIQKIPTGKPVVLVALHFTFDENYVAPESRLNVNRDDILAVDVLCYEDLGLLRCLRNDQALKTVTDYLISIGGSTSFQMSETPRPQRSWGYLSFIILIFFIFLITIAIAVAASIYMKGSKTRVFLYNESGKFRDAQKEIVERLKKRLSLEEVRSADECDVFISFVPIVSRAGTDIGAALQKIPTYTFFPKVFGNTMNSHELFMDRLKSKSTLREAYSENGCDVLICFVSIVSRAGTDIQAALEKIPRVVRAFVMVLGNTMDFHKTFLDNLAISTNLQEESLLKDSDVIIAFVPIVSRAGTDISAALEKIPDEWQQIQMDIPCCGCSSGYYWWNWCGYCSHKIFLMVLGNTMDCHTMFMGHLQSKVNLCEVKLADDCDFIIAFVPIVSRAGTDIQAAIEKIPGKPVVLVVLHHTFDQHYLPPDSRQGVKRDGVFAVDCLFHEDQGLLKCLRNHDAVNVVKNHLIEEEQHEDWTEQEDENRPLPVGSMSFAFQQDSLKISDFKMTQVFPVIINYFVMVLGNIMDSHKIFLDNLTISPNLREVFLLKDSNVIFAFVPIVSRAGTDIAAAMEKIPEGKPVVLVVLHHTFDPYYIAPDSRLCVKRDRVFAVDCLYYEDRGLLRCPRNDDAVRAVTEHLRPTHQGTDDFRYGICVL
ncbi:hypothetical protein DAT39_010061, partial [Clarias magur]